MEVTITTIGLDDVVAVHRARRSHDQSTTYTLAFDRRANEHSRKTMWQTLPHHQRTNYDSRRVIQYMTGLTSDFTITVSFGVHLFLELMSDGRWQTSQEIMLDPL